MSHDIFIGKARVQFCDDGELRAIVPLTYHPEAPVFPGDVPTRNTNNRDMAYSAMSEWVDAVGLRGLFFDREHGLLRKDRCCYRLMREHHEEVLAAVAKHVAKVGQKTPGWPPDGEDERYDPDLARLLWFEWWMRWALTDCETPAVYLR